MGTIQIDGSTPKLTIGNATAEDATILFDGNAQDFYIALDDSADDLLIGLGSTVGTTPAIAIDENLKVNIPVTTASTSASTGSLTTGGGAGIGADLYVGDDVYLITDSAVLGFGADKDTTLTHTDGTGLTLNSTNKLCFNDASQYIQGASGTVLDIAATDEIELTATLLDVNANLDVSGTSLLPTLGVVTAKDLGTGIHVRTADSSASVATAADELVLENGTSGAGCGISILSATDAEGVINFGDSGDADIGRIVYNHSNNYMYFTAGANEGLRIDATGAVTKPDQPCFHIFADADTNYANDAVLFTSNITEIYDLNADMSTGGIFTAPVTGKYHFETSAMFSDLEDGEYAFFRLVASNRELQLHMRQKYEEGATGYSNYWKIIGSCIVDMDASDTAKIVCSVDSTHTLTGSGSGVDSWFAGYLIC